MHPLLIVFLTLVSVFLVVFITIISLYFYAIGQFSNAVIKSNREQIIFDDPSDPDGGIRLAVMPRDYKP